MSVAFELCNDSSSVTNHSGATTNKSYNLDHDRGGGGIGGLGFSGRKMGYFPIYGDGTEAGNKSPELGGSGGRKLFEDDRSGDSSSSTSSIGRNSDDDEESSAESGGGDSEEVQSKLKTGALDSLEALEEVLPIKRSISQFYSGKSKSFTSLSDAGTCSSMNEIVKPENAYTRKRKNLMAFNNFWDNNKNHSSVQRSNGGGIAKRSTGSRSTLALAAAMGCTESSNNSDSSSSTSPSPGIRLPPLPPQRRRSPDLVPSSPPEKSFSPWRSFSLSDLQGADATPNISGIMVNNRHK